MFWTIALLDRKDQTMNYILKTVIFLLLTSSCYADYFHSFTQVSVQADLGRIHISRGILRSHKYVDQMCENRKELAAKGIYPDANVEEKTENQQTIEMEGQIFEVTITSNWLHTRGRAGAAPYNRLKIKIDGVLRYDLEFDEHPNNYTRTVQIEIQPCEKMITQEVLREISPFAGSLSECSHKYMWIHESTINFYEDMPDDWLVNDSTLIKEK